MNRYPGGKERGGAGKKPNLPRIEVQPALPNPVILSIGIGIAMLAIGTSTPRYDALS